MGSTNAPRDGTSPQQGQAEGTKAVQPGEGKALGRDKVADRDTEQYLASCKKG